MDNNENSILFSLTHLRRLASTSVVNGAGALTITRPIGSAPFIPLNVMPAMVLPPRRVWNAAWVMPLVVGLAGLLAITLFLLVVVVARSGGGSRPVAVPAGAPAVLAEQVPAPAPPAPVVTVKVPPAEAPAAEPEQPAPVAPAAPAAVEQASSTDEGETAKPAEAVTPQSKVAKKRATRGKMRGASAANRAHWAKSKPARKAVSHRKPTSKSKRVARRRSELDELLDAALH